MTRSSIQDSKVLIWIQRDHPKLAQPFELGRNRLKPDWNVKLDGGIQTRVEPYEIKQNHQKSNGTIFNDFIQLEDVFHLSGGDDLRLALYNGQLLSNIIQ